MSRGLNKAILIGNLGNDPEVRYTQEGSPVTTINIATTENWKNKSGERQEQTEWHRVVFFGKLAEIADEFLHKGSKVYIEGKIRTNKWQDKEGRDRYTTEIIANEMLMLDSRNQDPSGYNRAETTTDKPKQETPPVKVANDDFDDDIPF